MTTYLSQSLNINGQQVQGPLDAQFQNIGSVVNVVTTFMIPLGVIILLFSFIWAGFDLVTSQGSPEKIKSAQGKITTGVIGFIILVFALLVVKLIASIFGIGGGIVSN